MAWRTRCVIATATLRLCNTTVKHCRYLVTAIMFPILFITIKKNCNPCGAASMLGLPSKALWPSDLVFGPQCFLRRCHHTGRTTAAATCQELLSLWLILSGCCDAFFKKIFLGNKENAKYLKDELFRTNFFQLFCKRCFC